MPAYNARILSICGLAPGGKGKKGQKMARKGQAK
jgi:hypothetical protein